MISCSLPVILEVNLKKWKEEYNVSCFSIQLPRVVRHHSWSQIVQKTSLYNCCWHAAFSVSHHHNSLVDVFSLCTRNSSRFLKSASTLNPIYEGESNMLSWRDPWWETAEPGTEKWENEATAATARETKASYDVLTDGARHNSTLCSAVSYTYMLELEPSDNSSIRRKVGSYFHN